MLRLVSLSARIALLALGVSLASPVVAGVTGAVAPAAAAADCSQTVAGLDADGLVTGVAWQQCPSAEAVQDQNTLDIVMDAAGDGTLLLTTGKAAEAAPGADASHTWGTRSNEDAHDVVTADVGLTVPATHSCLAFDYVFASEEPLTGNSRANDGFVAELDASTWTLTATAQGGTLAAPDAFETATVVEQLESGTDTVLAGHGTAYEWTTQRRPVLLTGVSPGAHRLYLSVYEHVDGSRDTAVFLDHLRTFRNHPNHPEGDCVESNLPPTAVDDAAATAPGAEVSVPVLANDSDPDGDPLTVASSSEPAHGEVQCAGDSCTYTPDPLWMGTDSFEYTVDDGFGGSSTAAVQVDVAVVHLLAPGTSVTTWPTGVDLAGSLLLVDGVTPLPGRTLELWSAAGTGDGQFLAAAQTDANGVATWWHRPQRRTRYWVQPGGSGARSEEEATVGVRPLVSLAAAERKGSHRLRGRVTPARVGTPVRLERRLPGGSWRTIARTATTKASTALRVERGAPYSFSVRAPRGRVSYRVRLPADDGRLATYSAVRKLR